MTAIPPKTIAALLAQSGLALHDRQVTLTAIALAESGGEIDAVDGTRRGLWMIDDSAGFDARRMVVDAAYAARSAVEISGVGESFTPWPSYVSGDYRSFLNAARQATAQAAPVTGSITDPGGAYVLPTFTDPNATGGRAEDGSMVGADFNRTISLVAAANRGLTGITVGGPATVLTASLVQEAPLSGLRISGTEMVGDVSSIVIGAPSYSAGLTEIPNLSFTVADPQGDLLWQARNLWVRGARVEYLDLDLRIDEIKFEPGSHTTGQLTITAIDAMVYALQQLRGARIDKGGSPTWFIGQEVRLAGFDPYRYYLGEQMPTQTEIARDVPDAENTGGGDVPSAWTTVLRLAKERGKRAFMCGRKLIVGSTAFAADWASPGDLRIGWHNSPEGERWLSLPSTTQSSQGSKQGVTSVSGRVPLNRAQFFRPGVSVIVHHTPAVAAGDRRFVCSDVSFDLGRDTDGADVTLVEPVELEPEKTA